MAYAHVRCWGERYEVERTGSVWRRDDTGAQSASAESLLRTMLEDAASASGDDPEDDDIASQIDAAMDGIRYTLNA